ncbi:MAG: Protein SphX [Chroococcopsis gigantea SAG 12.99]|jgi:phosphate transport system substrate-binding protein|nr:PstS family phosphate ABC transporter substrate-binding protein [Chlorogloea purpurea SAG 13.99]MDV3000998.1 Protein SphX [Chroococcopsis gigantea SAG 12.99]
MVKKTSFLLACLLVGSNLLGSCERSDNQQQQIAIDGGAVGYSLSLAVAEEYQKVNPEARVSVAASGTGGGFSKFCAGNLDIAGASRVIRKEEIEKCQKNGVEFIELPMALDGLAVIVNKKNNFAKCLKLKELDKMWNAKAEGKIDSWQQVNPKFPNERLLLFAPPSDTGTFDYFTQAVTGKRRNSRTDFTPNRNQNALVQGVIGNPSSLAYLGIAFFMQNQDRLNVVSIENADGKCVKPVPLDNVLRNVYNPLSRPLFIYVSKKALDNNPSLEKFVHFYLENSWKWVDGVGYVALPDEAYVRTLQKFERKETGTKFDKAKPGEPITNFI